MQMHVQRHDAHVQGHLTPEGHEHARQVAQEKVNKYLEANPDTHFMVIASDQVFDDNEPDLGGVRAQETADEIIDTIRNTLEEKGLPADHLFGTDTPAPATSSPTLREANIFSNNFMQHLRSNYPEDNEWHLYYQDTDADTRKEAGAESAKELAQRMDYMIKTAEMAGASLHRAPGKEDAPLLVWIVGHGGGLDSYLHEYANVPLDELGFDLSGGFTLSASPEQGGVVADVKGKLYPIHTDNNLNLPA
jgi:broad specificity phosphatase PhoE